MPLLLLAPCREHVRLPLALPRVRGLVQPPLEGKRLGTLDEHQLRCRVDVAEQRVDGEQHCPGLHARRWLLPLYVGVGLWARGGRRPELSELQHAHALRMQPAHLPTQPLAHRRHQRVGVVTLGQEQRRRLHMCHGGHWRLLRGGRGDRTLLQLALGEDLDALRQPHQL